MDELDAALGYWLFPGYFHVVRAKEFGLPTFKVRRLRGSPDALVLMNVHEINIVLMLFQCRRTRLDQHNEVLERWALGSVFEIALLILTWPRSLLLPLLSAVLILFPAVPWIWDDWR